MSDLIVKTFIKKPEIFAGPVLSCPKCGRTILEAEIDRLVIRCPKCRRWISVKRNILDK